MSTKTRSAGPTSVVYDFGGSPLVLESADTHWLELLERRYGRFRRGEPSTGFRIHFEPEGAPPFDLVSPLAPRLEALAIERTPEGFRATSETTRCDVDLVRGEAVLRGPSAMYPLDNLLVQLLPLRRETDVLFHAAGLDLEGTGIVTAGPSGAGKSTLARLAGARALSDELVAVRAEPTGYRVLSLPFWLARSGSAPLAAILLLEHGVEHALRPLSIGEALRRLSLLTLWPTALPEAMERALSRLASLVSSVPALELSFAPRGDVVAFLEKELQ